MGFFCLFIVLEIVESIAFVVVGISIGRVEANGLVVGLNGLFIVLEVKESMAFPIVGRGVVGIEAQGLLIGG